MPSNSPAQDGARRTNCSGVPACQEDGPEAAAGSPLIKQRSAVEVPDGASATPSGGFHGTLLPKWYHQAMDDEHTDDALEFPTTPALATIPSSSLVESPATQEVRAFLSECGL